MLKDEDLQELAEMHKRQFELQCEEKALLELKSAASRCAAKDAKPEDALGKVWISRYIDDHCEYLIVFLADHVDHQFVGPGEVAGRAIEFKYGKVAEIRRAFSPETSMDRLLQRWRLGTKEDWNEAVAKAGEALVIFEEVAGVEEEGEGEE